MESKPNLIDGFDWFHPINCNNTENDYTIDRWKGGAYRGCVQLSNPVLSALVEPSAHPSACRRWPFNR